MVGDVGFILRSIHSNYLTIMHCFRRLCDVALFNPSSCFVKIMFNSFHLQSECCQNYITPIHSYLVSTRVVAIPSCSLCSSFTALQPPTLTWCSLFLFSTGMLSISFNSIVLFFQDFNLSMFIGFTHLSKKQLCLTSFSSASLRRHPRS